jgi:hypothetical protein
MHNHAASILTASQAAAIIQIWDATRRLAEYLARRFGFQPEVGQDCHSRVILEILKNPCKLEYFGVPHAVSRIRCRLINELQWRKRNPLADDYEGAREAQGMESPATHDSISEFIAKRDFEQRLETAAQREVCRLREYGYSNTEIAAIRGTSPQATSQLLRRVRLQSGLPLKKNKRRKP